MASSGAAPPAGNTDSSAAALGRRDGGGAEVLPQVGDRAAAMGVPGGLHAPRPLDPLPLPLPPQEAALIEAAMLQGGVSGVGPEPQEGSGKPGPPAGGREAPREGIGGGGSA